MDLTNLTKPLAKPPILTIVASPGAGKTTLAALFPNPIILQAEEVSGVFDDWEEDAKPMVAPPLPRARLKDETKAPGSDNPLINSTLAALKDQLRSLLTQDHEFQTVVIDSVTSLHTLFEHEVAVSYGVDNVADAAGGFHKGYLVVKEMHNEIKMACDYLRNRKNMTVIFLAHAGVKKIKNRPDADEYSVYSLDMHDASISAYTNLVDAVLYLRQDEYVKGGATDKKGNTTKFGKIIQSGDRSLITSGDGKVGYVNAKNRYSLEPSIAVPKGENPLLGLIPYFNKNAQ